MRFGPASASFSLGLRIHQSAPWAAPICQRRLSADEHSAPSVPSPGEVFVDRLALLEALRGAFRRGRVAIGDATGLYGSGKSTLLYQARQQLPLSVDLALSFRFSAPPRSGDEQIAAYGAFQDFVKSVAESIDAALDPADGSRERRLLTEFAEAYDRARVSTGAINNQAFVLFAILKGSPTGNVDVSAQIHSSILEKQPALAAAFCKLLRALVQERPDAAPRRILLALDGFEAIPEGQLRTWIIDAVLELESTLVLLPRTPDLAPAQTGPALQVSCPLEPFTKDEIRKFTQACLPGQELSDDLIEVIETATHGHAQAVGLAVELLKGLPPSEREARTVAAELANLPDDLARRHADMVEKILGREGVDAIETLIACAVLRKFDATMLASVLGSEVDFERVRSYSFVRLADDSSPGYICLHPLIGDELSRRLEQSNKQRFVDLHAKAAAYWTDWINGFEEDEGVDTQSGSYESWYRYEDAGWQAAKREWLYHQAFASLGGDKEERKLGRLRLARVFLDAFWWWGLYLEFPFCRGLVDDWRATQQDGEWTAAFDIVLDAYPPGYRKAEAPPGWRKGQLPRWDAVRAALLSMQEECGLSGGRETLVDKERRHTRGLIDVFLAHTARYRPAPSEADYADAFARYDEAVDLFEADNDAWDTGWTRFERAELHLERGHAGEARADWLAATKIAADEGDEELAANLHRLAADASAAGGELERAFSAHGRAVLHAYLFQRRPHPPDEYTLSFYGEQVGRSLDRLLGYADAGGDVARAAELVTAALPGGPHLVVGEVARLAGEHDRPSLAAALFPDPPLIEELHLKNSKFAQRWLLAEAALDQPSPADFDVSTW